MKTLSKILLVLVLATSASYAKPKKESIVILSVEHELFYFKASKNFLGASIEVYDSNNKLISTERVFDRKMVIDFYDLPSDSYSIKIQKDNVLLEYQFIKE